MPRTKSQSADQRRKLAKERMRRKRMQETAEEAEKRAAKYSERKERLRAEEALKKIERWRAADWQKHFPACEMFAQSSQRDIDLQIINVLKKAAEQDIDAAPGSGCEGDDPAVPATETIDHQKDGDTTLDPSSMAHTGQNQASKEVDMDQLEGQKLRQRIEVLHELLECELSSEQHQKMIPEKFRKALARAAETEEQRKERLRRNAKAMARARAAETKEEREERLRRSAKARARARAAETKEKREERLRRSAEAMARARANETKEKREQRLRREAERIAVRRRARQEQLLLQQQLSEGAEINTSESTGEVPQKCGFCEASFDDTDSLSRHIRIHVEKPHKCPLCLASFPEVSSLNAHIVTIHVGEKPHKCLICLASFSASGSLKAHIQTTHTGENPHKVIQVNVKKEPSMSVSESLTELGNCQIKEEMMDIEVVEHGLDQISY